MEGAESDTLQVSQVAFLRRLSALSQVARQENSAMEARPLVCAEELEQDISQALDRAEDRALATTPASRDVLLKRLEDRKDKIARPMATIICHLENRVMPHA
jgi:hypothetical protein